MCGIIGLISRRDVGPLLIEGLKNLEYRGYDSAGFAILKEHDFVTHKTVGRVAKLDPYVPEAEGGHIGHGAYPLGDPRRPDRDERPPALQRKRPFRGGSQRDHRELRHHPGVPGEPRRHLPLRDRHRSHSPAHRPRIQKLNPASPCATPSAGSREPTAC